MTATDTPTLLVGPWPSGTLTDVRNLPYLSIVGYIDGILAPGDRRGNDDPIAGADGELAADSLPLAKYVIRVPIEVNGDTYAQKLANLMALGPLIGGTTSGGRVRLVRRIPLVGGGTVDHSAPRGGRFITGLSASVLNAQTGHSELQYYQLNGYWLDPATSTRLVP